MYQPRRKIKFSSSFMFAHWSLRLRQYSPNLNIECKECIFKITKPISLRNKISDINVHFIDCCSESFARKIYIISRRMIYFTMIFVRQNLWAKSFEKNKQKTNVKTDNVTSSIDNISISSSFKYSGTAMNKIFLLSHIRLINVKAAMTC